MLDEGDPAAAFALFEQAAAIAERFHEADLATMSRLGRGQSLIDMGEIERGVAFLDDAMLAVTSGEVGPGRHRDRLLRLDRVVPRDLRPAPGPGLDRRVEPLVRRAARPRAVPRPMPRVSRRADAIPRGLARGDRGGPPSRAVAAPPAARAGGRRGATTSRPSCCGCGATSTPRSPPIARRPSGADGPEPGLAMLRLAQGRAQAPDSRCSTRALDETPSGLARAPLLAALVEIAIASGDVGSARTAADELARARRDRRRAAPRRDRDACRRHRQARRGRRPRGARRVPALVRTCGSRSTRRTRSARVRVGIALACRAARRRGHGGDRARRRARGLRAARSRTRRAPRRRGRRGATADAGRAQRPRGRGPPRGSPGAGRTARSRRRSGSASGPSTATSATSTRSSTCPPEPPRPRLPTSTASSELLTRYPSRPTARLGISADAARGPRRLRSRSATGRHRSVASDARPRRRP